MSICLDFYSVEEHYGCDSVMAVVVVVQSCPLLCTANDRVEAPWPICECALAELGLVLEYVCTPAMDTLV